MGWGEEMSCYAMLCQHGVLFTHASTKRGGRDEGSLLTGRSLFHQAAPGYLRASEPRLR